MFVLLDEGGEGSENKLRLAPSEQESADGESSIHTSLGMAGRKPSLRQLHFQNVLSE